MTQSTLGAATIGSTTIGGGVAPSTATTAPALPVFAPDIGPAFPFRDRLSRRVARFASIKGYEQIIPRGIRAQRVVSWQWESIPTRTVDYIVSFFEQFDGLGGPFDYDWPVAIYSPLGVSATLANTTGATTSSETFFVRFSWFSTSAATETEASPTASRLRKAGQLLTATAPVIPHGVDAVRFYVGTSAGAETLVSTELEREMTEPAGGFPSGGASPPTVNGLFPRLRFVLLSDIAPSLIACNRWSIALDVAERSM
jgi:hypothetical protein